MIDLIGDIHGYATDLEALLQKLGYTKKAGVYNNPNRKVLFVGDYIDRGPQIRETLQIVKTMVDSDNAIALMGNHEYNALCFHFQDANGKYLREHSADNIKQHKGTLEQFNNRQHEYKMYLEWFKSLPLYYETEAFRAVHACWDYRNIGYLKENLINGRLTDELIYQSAVKGERLNLAIDQTLKGIEIKMPNGNSFEDKDGKVRTEIRIKWWEDPSKHTYQSISVTPIENLPDQKLSVNELNATDYYREDDKKVFFGHYWLKGNPSFYRDNICCLDYSIAKNGKLVAYRLDHEEKLDNNKLIYVDNMIATPTL